MKKLLFIIIVIPSIISSQIDGVVGSVSNQSDLNIPPNAIVLNTLKAAPSIFGAGSETEGGRNGSLFIVDTLDRNGPLVENPSGVFRGGFFTALQHPNRGYIVFDVSGYIQLPIGSISVDGGTGGEFGFQGIPGVNNKTILGQTAPIGGVTLTGGTFRIGGHNGDANNLIFRYIRSRPQYNREGVITSADDAYTWAIRINGGNDIVIDHCSGSYAQDKTFGVVLNSGVLPNTQNNVTFSNNIATASSTLAYFILNPNLVGDPERNMTNYSIVRNVFVSGNRTPNIGFDGNAEVVNNIAHDTPTKNLTIDFDLNLNHYGNHYSLQNSERSGFIRDTGWNRILDLDDNSPGRPSIYSRKNYYGGTLTGEEITNNIEIWHEGGTGFPPVVDPNLFFVDIMHEFNFPNPYNYVSSNIVFNELVVNKNVGANKSINDDGTIIGFQDSHDSSQLDIVINNQDYNGGDASLWILPVLPVNTRPANYYVSVQGIPEWFVTLMNSRNNENITHYNDVIVEWDFPNITDPVFNLAGYTAVEMYSFYISGELE